MGAMHRLDVRDAQTISLELSVHNSSHSRRLGLHAQLDNLDSGLTARLFSPPSPLLLFAAIMSTTIPAYVPKFVSDSITHNKVVVFGKSTCPYTKKAKDTFATFAHLKGYLAIDLDKHGDMDAIQDYLAEITGARTVPRVFIGGKFFGGGDDVVNGAANGKLETALKEAGALE